MLYFPVEDVKVALERELTMEKLRSNIHYVLQSQPRLITLYRQNPDTNIVQSLEGGSYVR